MPRHGTHALCTELRSKGRTHVGAAATSGRISAGPQGGSDATGEESDRLTLRSSATAEVAAKPVHAPGPEAEAVLRPEGRGGRLDHRQNTKHASDSWYGWSASRACNLRERDTGIGQR